MADAGSAVPGDGGAVRRGAGARELRRRPLRLAAAALGAHDAGQPVPEPAGGGKQSAEAAPGHPAAGPHCAARLHVSRVRGAGHPANVGADLFQVGGAQCGRRVVGRRSEGGLEDHDLEGGVLVSPAAFSRVLLATNDAPRNRYAELYEVMVGL